MFGRAYALKDSVPRRLRTSESAVIVPRGSAIAMRDMEHSPGGTAGYRVCLRLSGKDSAV